VKIGNKASVKNSVILEEVIIEDGCQIDGCLIGKSAIITKDTRKTNEIINHFSKI
jgi:ADP-glucose pyrophosphorylase